MRKESIGLDQVAPSRPPIRLFQRVIVGALAVFSTPFVYEGVAVCVGNWRAAMGASSNVDTPVLDASLGFLGRIRDELAGLILPTFQHVPWQPSHVLVVAAIAMTASMLMLRR